VSTYLLLATRITLSFIRFGYIALLAIFISEENLASIFFISYLITFLAIVVPIEYHYAVLRKCNFKDDGICIESIPYYKHHLRTVNFLNYFFIFFASIFLIFLNFNIDLTILSSEFNSLNIILLFFIVFFETKNNELYRYFQVSRIDLQILNLLFRNLLPVVFHLALIIFLENLSVITSYLCLILFFNILASSLGNVYMKENIFKLDLAPSSPKLSNLKFLKYSFPIVLLSTFYMQLDKISLAYFLSEKKFIFYGFYSNISNFIIIFTQIVVIQPQLKSWYGNNQIKFNFFSLLKKVFIVFSFACTLLLLAVILSIFLPEVYKINFNASYIFLGYFLYGVSNVLTVMFYVTKKDHLLLKLESISVALGMCTFIFLFQLELIPVETFPLIMGLFLFICKAYPFIVSIKKLN
tara:strand:- start:4548 stop:5777 length:1230 start_codon:yes stop_codon:yes gene_type:complete